MIKIIKIVSMLLALGLTFNGCVLNLGESQGYCEEHGCDYSDAGVCGDAFEIYKTRHKDVDKSYEHIECSCRKGTR